MLETQPVHLNWRFSLSRPVLYGCVTALSARLHVNSYMVSVPLSRMPLKRPLATLRNYKEFLDNLLAPPLGNYKEFLDNLLGTP